jgi:hypothetical protein
MFCRCYYAMAIYETIISIFLCPSRTVLNDILTTSIIVNAPGYPLLRPAERDFGGQASCPPAMVSLRSDGGRADRSPCDAWFGVGVHEHGALVQARARRVTGWPHKTQGRDIPGPTALTQETRGDGGERIHQFHFSLADGFFNFCSLDVDHAEYFIPRLQGGGHA